MDDVSCTKLIRYAHECKMSEIHSGVTRESEGGRTHRVTPSMGVIPDLKLFFLWLNLERTLDKRRVKMGVVRRRQLKKQKSHHCQMAMTKERSSDFFKEKN